MIVMVLLEFVFIVFTIYGFSGLNYSSPTEPFSAQAHPKQALHVSSSAN